MDISVDVWLRGDNHATTYVINPVGREPGSWTESDVSAVLVSMLRTPERAVSRAMGAIVRSQTIH
jgi:hypothetical protein